MSAGRSGLSIRARLAVWIAGLVTLSGAVVVVIVVLLARQKLHDVAEQSNQVGVGPAAQGQFGPGGQPIGATPGRATPGAATPGGPAQSAQGRAANHAFHQVELDGFEVLAGCAHASVLIGWFVSGQMLGPLRNLETTIHGIRSTDLSRRIGLAGPDDELHRVADAFDQMLDRLEVAFRAQEAFVADASHELRTPLTVMRAEVDVALDDADATAPELRDALQAIGEATGRAQALAEALLVLAASDSPPAPTPVDLAACAQRAIENVQRVGIGDRVLTATCEPATMVGDPVRLERIAANLVENAVRYNHDGGSVMVRTGQRQGQSYLLVENDGPIIDPSEVGGLFERFRRRDGARTREAGGFGLGLAIVAGTVRGHGGIVEAKARPAGGLAVTVRFPTSPSPVLLCSG